MSRAATWTLMLAALCLVVGSRATAQNYNSNADFSLAGNPNGVWSYGSSATLTGPITLFDTTATANGGALLFWKTAAATPWVGHNVTGDPITFGSATIAPAQLAMMPSTGAFTHVKFTAPSSGQFFFSFVFTGYDTTSTDVHFLRSGVDLWDKSINGLGNQQGFGGSPSDWFSLSAGDSLDFVVGPGADGWDSHDTTGFYANIQGPNAVPLPPAAVITMFGGVCTLFTVRRRARK